MNELENVDLKLVLRNTARAARDAEAAFEATERLVVSIGARFDSIDSRIDALEARFGALETRMNSQDRRIGSIENGIDSIARSNHRMEQMLSDIFAKLPP